MSTENTKILSRNSVERAMKLYAEIEKGKKRKRSKDQDEETHKYSVYCNPLIGTDNKKSIASTFSPNFALNEMRLCLMKHDWVNLQRLFPLILQLSSLKETLVWRYALTILLHSPNSSEANLKEFFNLCIGCPDDNFKKALTQLISLDTSENSKQIASVKTPRRKSTRAKKV